MSSTFAERRARRHRLVVLVDELDDADVGVEHERFARRARSPPTRPSVDPNVLTIGAPNALEIASRCSGSRFSLVAVIDEWGDVQATSLLLQREPGDHRRVAGDRGGCRAFSRETSSFERKRHRHSDVAKDVSRRDRGRDAGCVHRRCGTQHRDVETTGRWSSHGRESAHRVPLQRAEELDERVAIQDEAAALARAAARRHADVLVEKRLRLVVSSGQRVVDEIAGEAAIRDHVVEVAHHLGLGHYREVDEIRQLDAERIDALQTTGMKRRVCDGVAEQGAQSVALALEDLLDV